MSKYGKTKLDHYLSYFAMAFEKILEFLAILFVPGVIVQQTVIYGANHPGQVLPVLFALMILLVIVGAYVLTKKNK